MAMLRSSELRAILATSQRTRRREERANVAGVAPSRSIRGRGRGMNRWEREYAAVLETRKLAGEVIWWAFEAITLKLGHDCRYTPDFAVVPAGDMEWIEFHEVKGFWRDDAKVKIRVAAGLFPWARFVVVTKPRGHSRGESGGGGWKAQEF